MKKIIITILGLLMITSTSAQENGYIPVLTEGKSWEVVTINRDNTNDTTGYYNIFVEDDIIVNSLTCKKIEIVPKENQDQAKTIVAYEENGKVWKVNNDGELELLFDIGLKQNNLLAIPMSC